MAVAEVQRGDSYRAAVVACGAQWQARQYELVRSVAALDASDEWVRDGAVTCAHWVAEALDIEVCTAREWVRIGRALMDLPELDGAFARGEVSYSKVRALTRVAESGTEHELVALARRVPACALVRELARWQQGRETPAQTEGRHRRARSCTRRDDVDGMKVWTLRMTPEQDAVLHGAVEAHLRVGRPDASADAWPSLPQQRLDAVLAILRHGGVRTAVEIVLHLRGDGATMDDGSPIPTSVLERIAPEAFLRVLIHDAKQKPINASGRHRHPTDRQKRVAKERARGRCVDCGSTDLLDYDHDPPYEQTRHTVVDELAVRCAPCHHRRHRRLRRARP